MEEELLIEPDFDDIPEDDKAEKNNANVEHEVPEEELEDL